MNYVVTSNEFLLIWNHTLDQKIDISQEACIFFFRLAEFFGKFLSSKSLNLSTPVASAACFLVSVLVRTLHLSIFYERSKYLDIRLGDCSLFTINLPKFRLNIKIFYGGETISRLSMFRTIAEAEGPVGSWSRRTCDLTPISLVC